MKVLLLNGSPRAAGCTYTALNEIARVLETENVETEILQCGNKHVRDCIACGGCVGKGKCVFDDDIANTLIEKMQTADGFIVGTPVYYAHPTGRVLSILDRAFYA
ncbi:MAG: flavodoxin family protein, partial [Clostridiales bacterium]|nr:flavodoxin family protein [Clostridiales bacterium]